MSFGQEQTFKSSYSFTEVSSITSIKPYVLRFWESEFDEIDPVLNEDGSKIYSSKDLEAILYIKNLLFEQKMSIPEAKAFITKNQVTKVIESAGVINPTEKDVVETSLSQLAIKKVEGLISKIDLIAKSKNWDI